MLARYVVMMVEALMLKTIAKLLGIAAYIVAVMAVMYFYLGPALTVPPALG
jgi:hypothetical protein